MARAVPQTTPSPSPSPQGGGEQTTAGGGVVAVSERCDLIKKRQRTDLDAFARVRVRRRGRVVEGGVGRPAGTAVLDRVVDLEDQRLIAPHARQPVPTMRRIVGDRIGLADAVGIAPLGNHEIVERDAARVADCERRGFDRVADRAPDLHDGEVPLQQGIGFVGKKVAHALRARPFRIVVVHAAHDLADLALFAQRIVGGAQRMVEHHHPRGAALRLHQCFHLGIVDAADLVFVEEILHFGVVAREDEAVAIEDELALVAARIVHGDGAGVRRAAAAHIRSPGRRGLGEDLLTVIGDVVDSGLDCLGDRFRF